MRSIEETSKMVVERTERSTDDFTHVKLHLYDPITSDEVLYLIDIIFSVTLTGIICLLGSAANIINIIIFCRQSLNNSVNISLLGLAVSDLCSLLPLMWRSIALNPLFRYSDINFDSIQVQYLTAGWIHACFTRITVWITAFITFERCVCIALPTKVKNIITPKRTFISVLAMFMTMFANVSPVFCSIQFAPSFQAQRNKTLYILSYAINAVTLQNISFAATVFIQLSSFAIVVICTVILIHNLRVKSQWRHNAAASSDFISLRDKRVLKMVTMIASIFIVCLLPSSVTVILMLHLSPDFSNVGRYQNSYNVTWAMLNMVEAINNSVSILVYYNMSSKYRAGFNSLFIGYRILLSPGLQIN